ncbi:DNA polymerase [Clostridia bacterium]|nr:DNA polymerase [Clostridia bacterium]
MKQKLLLVDGHSILNRAFYAIPHLSNTKGLETNAVYGFLMILFRVLEEEKPDYLTVAFDVHSPTFRHDLFKEYKGTRKAPAPEFREQVPRIKEVLAAMDVYCIEKAGYEADDLLGTVAKMSVSKGFCVTILSGDRDLLQLAEEDILIRIPKTKQGKTEIEDYHAKEVENTYQVSPLQFIDVKALMGDSSDNVPGVPGIGEKTAIKLVSTFGSFEEIYKRIEEVKPARIQTLLQENQDLAHLSKTLVTIKLDCAMDYDWKKAKLTELYTAKAYTLFQELEFKSLLSRFSLNHESMPKAQTSDSVCREIYDHKEAEIILTDTLDKLEGKGEFLLSLKIEKKNCQGLFLAWEEERYFFALGEELSLADLVDFWWQGKEKTKGQKKITFAFKEQLSFLTSRREFTFDDMEDIEDLSLIAYLLNPLKESYQNQKLSYDYLQETFSDKEEEYSTYYVSSALRLYPLLKEMLISEGMLDLYEEIEKPSLLSLFHMEQEGIQVEKEQLALYGEKLKVSLIELEKEIFAETEEEFNLLSPKQLGEVLFEHLKLPHGKKTKTGYSTAAEILEKLAPDYPIVEKILNYRQLSKLKSTYAEGLAQCIQEDGRIHSTFNQMITATGRISSTEPNLQNIPIRMELGRAIRKVFVPRKGFVFVDADYSQIELRVLAHLSQDEKLIEAYRQAQDIHQITASEVFHVPLDEVTPLQRRNAKAVNFGIVYGISAFSLGEDLNISREEAAKYQEQYFATYPKVKQFLTSLVESAKKQGSVQTLFRRTRPVPELKSSAFMQRAFGERVAMNAPIQGTAADIIKKAMVAVDREIREQGLSSRLILQIHDELLIETKKEEIEQLKEILFRQMSSAADLLVPLEIDLHVGEDWYAVK